jgi:hypothetical protein
MFAGQTRPPVEIRGALHTFIVEDQSHPPHGEIPRMVSWLNSEMRKMGYAPRTEFVYLYQSVPQP